MSWSRLTPVLDVFGMRYGYLPQGGPYDVDSKACACYSCVRSRGESVLHELCHGVLLEIGRRTTDGSTKIAARLNRWHDRNADHHEMKTVALEILVSRRYRVRLGLRTLLTYSMKGMRYYPRSEQREIERQVKKYMKCEEIKRGVRRTIRLIERVRVEAAFD